MLQVSPTSDERPASQVPSHVLAVIQASAKASSESDSSPRAHGRSRSSGSVRSASAVALGSRHAPAPTPYARNKAKPVMLPPLQATPALLPPPSYACEVALLATRYLSVLRVPLQQPQVVMAFPPRH